jgi:16S rRNA U516 pseudouridylate synthase RsuA-like enzyme
MDEERFNTSVRKFLRQVGVTSQQEIEKLVQSGAVTGPVLKVRMTLTAENAPLEHVVEADIDLGDGAKG